MGSKNKTVRGGGPEMFYFTSRTFSRMKIEESIRGQALVACKQPVLPINSPEIMKFVKEVPPIDCSKAGLDWVTCEVLKIIDVCVDTNWDIF